jgi:predicted SnoaL-like aldol condensation-catalyzing enzyme
MTKSNKEIALEVLTRAFTDRDPTVVEQLFSVNYKQHNPAIPDGPAAIAKMIPTLTNLRYEPGMAVAEGNLVMVHGRYTGWGPKPMVAVDIFRVEGGKVLEHWDVLQEEVPIASTANGNPMFTKPREGELNHKAFVLAAFDALFNRRDYAAAEKFWSPTYIQHSAHIPPGRDGLFNLVKAAPPTLRYESHLIMAEGDYVIAHGRFSGHGRPANWVACDILRIENGLLAEHWDVLQDESTRATSVSGLPMFGDKFPA